jgi:hypothetical protein
VVSTLAPIKVVKNRFLKSYLSSTQLAPLRDGTAGSSFAYPHDEINFPASGVLTPAATLGTTQPTKSAQYCFTPEPGEECVYTVGAVRGMYKGPWVKGLGQVQGS